MPHEQNPFLSRKYPDLPGSKPVESAVQKKVRLGEKGPATKEDRVEAYLDRLEDLIKNPHAFGKLKNLILAEYVTKPKDIPESYWKSQEAEARRRGEGGDLKSATEEQKAETRRLHAETVLHDQRASLEQWVDYFASPDSEHIPRNLKYWVFRNVLNLQELVKKKEGETEHIEFPKRSKGTVKPFPDINYEALSYVVDAVVKKLEGKSIEFEHDIQLEEREAFSRILAKEDFAKLYAWANELHNPIPEHLLPVTEGEWVMYGQGSDPEQLVKTIRGKGTGWCTAGLNTAKNHLQGGDFHVYYSLDDNAEATVPRLAIRMEGREKIAEDPRGIAYKQNIDPFMPEILESKLKEFGKAGEVYHKQSSDMKRLTAIENKTNEGQPLTKDDLIFLYEINSRIEGFGYERDPRVEELRSKRNPEADMPVIFECEKKQIARSAREVNEHTKAYVGPLFPGIFKVLGHHEHIYTSFPEGKITRYSVEIGGHTEEQLEDALERAGFKISDYASHMMRSGEFKTAKRTEQADLVRLQVGDLFGDKNVHTTDEIYTKADQLGLELCPAEVGPHLRLKLTDQPLGDWFRVAMKQITGPDGSTYVFGLGHVGVWLWLDNRWAEPARRWRPGDAFVFRLRK